MSRYHTSEMAQIGLEIDALIKRLKLDEAKAWMAHDEIWRIIKKAVRQQTRAPKKANS